MKKSRYTEEKIIGVLKQVEAGRKVAELALRIRAAAGDIGAAVRLGNAQGSTLLCLNLAPNCCAETVP